MDSGRGISFLVAEQFWWNCTTEGFCVRFIVKFLNSLYSEVQELLAALTQAYQHR